MTDASQSQSLMPPPATPSLFQRQTSQALDAVRQESASFGMETASATSTSAMDKTRSQQIAFAITSGLKQLQDLSFQKPSLLPGANGCVVRPPPTEQQLLHDGVALKTKEQKAIVTEYGGRLEYLVKLFLVQEPAADALLATLENKADVAAFKADWADAVRKNLAEVQVGKRLIAIDPLSRLFAGLIAPYPFNTNKTSVYEEACIPDNALVFAASPQSVAAYVLRFRGLDLFDVWDEVYRLKQLVAASAHPRPVMQWTTEVAPLFRDMIDGCNVLHNQLMLVHSDIRMPNVVVSLSDDGQDWQATLIDFGACIDVSSSSQADNRFAQQYRLHCAEQLKRVAGLAREFGVSRNASDVAWQNFFAKNGSLPIETLVGHLRWPSLEAFWGDSSRLGGKLSFGQYLARCLTTQLHRMARAGFMSQDQVEAAFAEWNSKSFREWLTAFVTSDLEARAKWMHGVWAKYDVWSVGWLILHFLEIEPRFKGISDAQLARLQRLVTGMIQVNPNVRFSSQECWNKWSRLVVKTPTAGKQQQRRRQLKQDMDTTEDSDALATPTSSSSTRISRPLEESKSTSMEWKQSMEVKTPTPTSSSKASARGPSKHTGGGESGSDSDTESVPTPSLSAVAVKGAGSAGGPHLDSIDVSGGDDDGDGDVDMLGS
jgi:hypothetical protein